MKRKLNIIVACEESQAVCKAFRKLGAEVYVINDNPDGTNINEKCGSTHPEELQEYVVKKNCDIGFAFDGDADRCLAVDEKGNLINGDFILMLCAKHLKDIGKHSLLSAEEELMSAETLARYREYEEGVELEEFLAVTTERERKDIMKGYTD